jgi:hypothetical protein
MRNKNNLYTRLCVLAFSCISIISFGQTKKFSISGTVADTVNRIPIEYASVAIYTLNNTSPLTGTITNEKGEFVIHDLVNGEYRCYSSEHYRLRYYKR